MRNQRLHTPDGVRDIYNGECQKKLLLQDQLHGVLLKYGYRDIQTPTFEFFDIFGQEIGTTPSKDLYKFFDKEGNTLVLRPDFTPSIARSAAKYYVDDDMPVKLCYMGNTFLNSSDYQGRLKESTQCGAELIGDASVSADAEILAMAAECLKSCGLRDFRISVGHAQFFSGLVAAAGLGEEEEQTLRELISNKNFFGVEEFTETLSIDENLKRLFTMLGSFDIKEEELSAAEGLAADYPQILSALQALKQLYRYVKLYEIEDYISYELGIISDYRYYTGILFLGYTFGTGEPIVRGGRYDKLLSYFGRQAPSIGFGIVVDQLMAALSRQKIAVSLPDNGALIVFTEENSARAIRRASKLRREGISASLVAADGSRTREDYIYYAQAKNITRVEFFDGVS